MSKSELPLRLKRIQDKRAALKLAQEDWLAENKSFNEWAQTTLGVKDHQGEMHLAEILTKWSELNDEVIPDSTTTT